MALAEEGAFTVIDFRDRPGSGRKLAVEMLEFFDAIGFTRRRGVRDRACPESPTDEPIARRGDMA